MEYLALHPAPTMLQVLGVPVLPALVLEVPALTPTPEVRLQVLVAQALILTQEEGLLPLVPFITMEVRVHPQVLEVLVPILTQEAGVPPKVLILIMEVEVHLQVLGVPVHIHRMEVEDHLALGGLVRLNKVLGGQALHIQVLEAPAPTQVPMEVVVPPWGVQTSSTPLTSPWSSTPRTPLPPLSTPVGSVIKRWLRMTRRSCASRGVTSGSTESVLGWRRPPSICSLRRSTPSGSATTASPARTWPSSSSRLEAQYLAYCLGHSL